MLNRWAPFFRSTLIASSHKQDEVSLDNQRRLLSDKVADSVDQQHHNHSTHHSQHRRCHGFGSRSTEIRARLKLGMIAQIF